MGMLDSMPCWASISLRTSDTINLRLNLSGRRFEVRHEARYLSFNLILLQEVPSGGKRVRANRLRSNSFFAKDSCSYAVERTTARDGSHRLSSASNASL